MHVVEHEDEDGHRWIVTNPKKETLTITLHEVLSDSDHELGTDPGLQKDGVEAHLQELLAASPAAIEDGLTLVRREYPTAIGPIDLVCRDAADQVVAVEVKRRGEIDGVEQLARYIERLELDSSLGDIRGVFVGDNTYYDWFKEITLNTISGGRLTVTVSLLNEKNEATMVWTLNNAWPTKITSTDLKSDGNEAAIDTIEIAYESIDIVNNNKP